MAFSIRNIFGSNPDDPIPSDTSHSSENLEAAPAANAGFLFKTAPNASAPSIHSMSNQTPAQPGATSLVLADVIASIPQELRNPAFTDLQRPIKLPTSVLREHLGRGKAALPLAEVYRVLPEAFAHPVEDQDTRGVAVPPMKLVSLIAQLKAEGPAPQETGLSGLISKAGLPPASGGTSQSDHVTSSFSHLPPPHRSESNPFNTLPKRRAELHAEPAPESPAASPFSKVDRPAAAASPFTPVAPSEAPPANALPTPSLATPKPAAAPSPFTAVKPQASLEPVPAPPPSVAQGPTSEPVSSPFDRVKALTSKARPVTAPVSEPTVGLGLRQLLQGVSPHHLGFDAQSLPNQLQAQIPVSILRSKLHQPTPSLSLGELSQYVQSDLASLLQTGDLSTQVELPVNQLYHQLAQQEGSSAGKESPPASSPKNAPSSLEAFPALPELETEVEPSVDRIETMPTFAPAPELAAPPQPVADLRPEPEPLPISGLFRPQVSSAPSGVEAPLPPTAPALVTAATPIAKAELNSPETAAPSSPNSLDSLSMNAPLPPAQDSLDLGRHHPISKSRSDQLIWRVLFGVKTELDAQAVLELTRKQLQVPAVAVIQAGKVTVQSFEPSEAAQQFLAQAPKICEHLQPLVQLTGIQDAETFSIKHHDYMNTFSAQGHYTLAIMHPPVADETGLKEKLTLIARELSPMLAP